MEEERKFGLIPDSPDSRDLRFGVHFATPLLLPNTSQTLWPFVPPAVDQLQRSCCTGAAGTRAAKAFMNRTGYIYPHMPSCFYLYAKVREFEGTPLDEDSGAMIRDIFKVWNRDGVCPEDSNEEWSWPFAASDDTWKTPPPKACVEHAAKHKIQYMRLSNRENEIKTALWYGYPVVIGVAVPESMMSKKTAEDGIIRRSSQSLGWHCMWLHDYGLYKEDYADGLNSWGPKWGSKKLGVGGNFHVRFKDLIDPNFCCDIWAITGYS